MEANPERKSGVSRVVSESPEREAALSKRFEDALRTQEIGSFERSPTPEERAVIVQLIPAVAQFVEKYGGTPVEGISAANVHILDPDRLAPEDREAIDRMNIGGLYDRERQAIFIVPDDSLLTTAQRIAHELIHFHSFQSVHDEGPEGQPSPRRIGFSAFDRSMTTRYFRDLDEAIVEELALRLDDQCFKEFEVLTSDLTRRERLRSSTRAPREIAAVTDQQLPDGAWQTRLESWRYSRPRARLGALLKSICDRDRGRFRDPEAVFEVFARAVFTGRLLEVARLVDDTFGKGFFAALARETMTSDDPPQRAAQDPVDDRSAP